MTQTIARTVEQHDADVGRWAGDAVREARA
jgi:hypothetical protein